MVGLADEGMLFKAKETIGVMARRRPSIAGLLENRTQRFTRLHVIVPSTVTTGEAVDVTIQARDQCERLVEDFTGGFTLDATDEAAELPDRIKFPAENDGVATLSSVSFATPGTHYLTFTHDASGERFVSNPVRVSESEPDYRLYWGDIHLHSKLSDGCGTPTEGYRFGRDVMDLDVVAYTDHDTMGFFIPPSLQRRRMHRRYFDQLKDAARQFHDPGEYVTLFGYEWTKQPNVGGHVNVYFDGVDDATLIDSIAPESNTYEKLFARLHEYNEANETQALAIPHHPAEGSYPFDFSAIEYDDEIAPLVEIYSQWGSSERPGREGNRHPVLMGQGEADEPGHYVQDALEMGNEIGLMAAADFHGPNPGHSLLHAEPHLPSREEWKRQGVGWGLIWRVWNEPSYPGGLTGFWAPELSREAIFESLRSRRVYGTSQPNRIIVEFAINGVEVGEADSHVTVEEATAPRDVSLSVAGTGPIQRATIVRNNEPWRTAEVTDDPDADLETYTIERSWTDEDPITGMAWDDERGTDSDVYYVRLRQADGGMAWAGPLWVGVSD